VEGERLLVAGEQDPTQLVLTSGFVSLLLASRWKPALTFLLGAAFGLAHPFLLDTYSTLSPYSITAAFLSLVLLRNAWLVRPRHGAREMSRQEQTVWVGRFSCLGLGFLALGFAWSFREFFADLKPRGPDAFSFVVGAAAWTALFLLSFWSARAAFAACCVLMLVHIACTLLASGPTVGVLLSAAVAYGFYRAHAAARRVEEGAASAAPAALS